MVWLAQGVPRFAFITWLALKNMVSTSDRMNYWGVSQGCGLCGKRDETRDHIFFACPYTYDMGGFGSRLLTGI